MTRALKILSLAIIAATFLFFQSRSASAQNGAAGSVDVVTINPTTFGGPLPNNPKLRWSVKFLCGTIPADRDNTEFPGQSANALLVPGTYLTIANVVNFNDLGGGRVVLSVFVSGDTNSRFTFTAIPLEDQTFDCVDFLITLGIGGPDPLVTLQTDFFLGYLLMTDVGTFIPNLSVVGIYTFKNVENENVQVPPIPPIDPPGRPNDPGPGPIPD